MQLMASGESPEYIGGELATSMIIWELGLPIMQSRI
jgi:hypothetical protein